MKTLQKFLICACVFAAFASQQANAQQDEQSSLYMFNPMQFNPAYAGSRGTVNITGIGRFQWVGIKGAPVTQFVSVHAPFRDKSVGIGLNMTHDQIGSRNRTSAFANFSFGIRVNKKGDRFAFGASAGMDYMQYNFSTLNVVDPGEEIYINNYAEIRPNFGLGIYYYGERHFLGLSAPRLLESRINNDTLSTAIQTRHFFLTGGYVFKLNSALQLKTSALVKVTPYAPMTFDVNVNFLIYDRLSVGAMYRFHESVGANISVKATNWLTFGYAYDFPVNSLRLNQFGTHEVMLAFDFATKKGNYTSPRYF